MEISNSGILSSYFKIDTDNDVKTYMSNKTSFGMSPRYDMKLWVISQEEYTEVRWVGQMIDDIIFHGDGVKTEEDLVQVLKYLGVYDFVVSK